MTGRTIPLTRQDDKEIEMTPGVGACGHDVQEHQVVPKYPAGSLE